MAFKKSDIDEMKRTVIAFSVLGCVAVVGYSLLAAYGFLLPEYVAPPRTVCLVAGAAIAAFIVPYSLGALCVFFSRKSLRKASRSTARAIWGPLEEWQTPADFKRYTAKSFQSATALGYVPAGTYVVNATLDGWLKTTCLVHPEGHSVIHLGQADLIEKMLRLSRAAAQAHVDNDPEYAASLDYSDMASYGYLVNSVPGASIEELIKVHEVFVTAALADPNIGLRKLSVKNCRDYGLYSTRRFNQIQFELDKRDKGPKPFTFPVGDLVSDIASAEQSSPELAYAGKAQC